MVSTNQTSVTDPSFPNVPVTRSIACPISSMACVVFSNAVGVIACYVIEAEQKFDFSSVARDLALRCDDEIGTHNIDWKIMCGPLTMEQGSFNLLRDFPDCFPI